MSTGISWCDEVWNPVTGCSRVSEGCRNCYAAALAPRLAAMGKKGYTDLPWTAQNASENVTLHEDRLEKPLSWKKPRRVFVNSMSDLFHEQVPDEFILKVWTVMRRASQHTFQILTKRPERMAEFVQRLSWVSPTTEQREDGMLGWQAYLGEPGSYVLPNVWLGTSVEDQRAADERIPHLLRTPAAIRFLSCEPLLGPLDIVEWLHDSTCVVVDEDVCTCSEPREVSVDWVIAGGESGPKHRPMEKDWARSLRDSCSAATVPFFFKQSSGVRNEMDPFLDGAMHREMPRSCTGRGVAV